MEKHSSLPPAIKNLSRLKELVHALVIIITAVVTGVTTVWTVYHQLATDAEVEAAVRSASAPLRKDVLTLQAALAASEHRHQQELAAVRAEVSRATASANAVGKRLISIMAADLEKNPMLRSAASAFYREEYMRRIERGANVDDALNEALHTPWYERPRR